MTIALHDSLARAQLLATISALPDIGQVHDYERFADDWGALQAMYRAELSDGSSLLLGWAVSLGSIGLFHESFGDPGAQGVTEVTYGFKVRGYMAVSDADASEKAFVAKAVAILQAIDAEPKLHSSRREAGATGEFYGATGAAARFDFRMFGDVLVHAVDIDVEVREVA